MIEEANPSCHYWVNSLIYPYNSPIEMDFGLRVCLLIVLYFGAADFASIYCLCMPVKANAKRSELVVLPEFEAPTIMTPNLTLNVS